MRRVTGFILVVVCVGLMLWTGLGLKQAFDLKGELKGQIHDFAAAERGAQGSAAAVGVTSLERELGEVRGSARRREVAVAGEALGLVVGLVLLGRSVRS